MNKDETLSPSSKRDKAAMQSVRPQTVNNNKQKKIDKVQEQGHTDIKIITERMKLLESEMHTDMKNITERMKILETEFTTMQTFVNNQLHYTQQQLSNVSNQLSIIQQHLLLMQKQSL